MEERKNVRIAVACTEVQEGKNATFKFINDYSGQRTGKSAEKVITAVVKKVAYAETYPMMKVETEDDVFYVPCYHPYGKKVNLGYAVTAKGNEKVVFIHMISNGKDFKTKYESSDGVVTGSCNVDKNFVQVTTDKDEEFFLEFPPSYSNVRISVPN